MQRLDIVLVKRGLVDSRSKAQRLISDGKVKVQGKVINKPSYTCLLDADIELMLDAADLFASRGGIKLSGALAHTGVSLENAVVIDVGQSTGGFTDCALKSGAAKVVGIEVGHDQLIGSLRQDSRVVCLEGMNARELPDSLLDYTDNTQGFDVAVMDVSFISQTKILPALAPLLKQGGQLISLVKPQFEVGSAGLGKRGIVKNEALYKDVERSICACCKTVGLKVKGYFASSITGGDGNKEFFVWAERV